MWEEGVAMTIRKHNVVWCFLFFALLFSGCASQKNNNAITLNYNSYSNYNNAVTQALPEYTIRLGNKPAFNLNTCTAIETYSFFAEPFVETNPEAYWYPQYRATVVIAIDRSQTNVEINGWRDLANANEMVSMPNENSHLFFPAISYGLEGENYTSYHANTLLGTLHQQKLFALDNMNASILICFDYQAVALIESGRNLEIIIPQEGTFYYDCGLLSSAPLIFSDDINTILLSYNLRLPDGSNLGLYPDVQEYETATYPQNTLHLNRFLENANRTFRRGVLQSHLFNTADAREHHLMVLVFSCIVIVWTGYVLHRILQKRLRQTVAASSFFVIGWVVLRAFKWQLPSGTLSRYCWYGYYFFQLALPLVMLLVAWYIDKIDDVIPTPKWWKICVAVNISLFLAVATNDLHLQVFMLDSNDWLAESSYSYGILYCFIALTIFIELLFAFVTLISKSKKSPYSKGRLYPIALFFSLAAYSIMYALKVPLVAQSDVAIVTCIFSILFIESCIQVGLIPVNRQYRELFAASTLRMQIVNHLGETLFASTKSIPLNNNEFVELSKQFPKPLLLNNNTLLFSIPVAGGSVVWQGDISRVNRLSRRLQSSIASLNAANSLLEKQSQVEERLGIAEARVTLFSELETEIEAKTLLLSSLIHILPTFEDKRLQTARITLLLCYIKRRCNLFFREKESALFSAEELNIYFSEIAEFSELTGIRMHIAINEIPDLPIRQATLFYDFLYAVLEWCIYKGCHTILVNITFLNGLFSINFLPSIRAEYFALDPTLSSALQKESGIFSVKDLDETIGITLSFPEKEDMI